METAHQAQVAQVEPVAAATVTNGIPVVLLQDQLIPAVAAVVTHRLEHQEMVDQESWCFVIRTLSWI
jgi:hypothetical protein